MKVQHFLLMTWSFQKSNHNYRITEKNQNPGGHQDYLYMHAYFNKYIINNARRWALQYIQYIAGDLDHQSGITFLKGQFHITY
jgi:hypothetical protein